MSVDVATTSSGVGKVAQMCLICNGNCKDNKSTFKGISCSEIMTGTERPLADILREIVDKKIEETTLHSQVLCQKCYKLLNEYEDLQSRARNARQELTKNFKNNLTKTIEKPKTIQVKILEASAQKLEIKEEDSQPASEVPKKILDIPSSDDDTTQGDKQAIPTIEDIELELVKMHEGIDQPVTLEQQQAESEGDVVTTMEISAEDIEEEDVIIQASSDSEFDPNDRDEAQEDDETSDLVKIKLESSEESQGAITGILAQPNILKKRFLTVNSPSGLTDKKIEVIMDVPSVAREGSLYTCLLCQGEETVAGAAKAIIAHMRSEHNTRLYICDVCGMDFKKRNELSAHIDEHVATEEGDFQCEVCNRIFSNLRLFRIHRRMHYPQNKAWACDSCGKKYTSKNLLEEHYNTHLGLRPYTCKSCGKDFASKYTFKAHEKTHEVRPRPFRCMHCPKTFLTQQNLSQHERTHTGLKEYECHLCGKQFGSSHNLEVHSIVHTGYKPFVCGMCGKAFARKAEIRDHERTHTGERPYQCEFCGATFSQRSNLQSHKRATHYDDKRYRCDVCNKGFKRRRLLDYHMKAAHTGERPFKCETCEATFVYPEHFKKHRRIHTGEKPFLCEVCGKAFNSRDNRNAHRFVHSDKKPYECLVCGAGFMRKPLLYQHMQAQNHLNDTIVVNQPRLTTDDDQLVTVNAAGDMEIVDPVAAAAADSKLYITDHDGEHIIIDGQQINFADTGSEDEDDEGTEAEIVDEIEQVVTEDFDEIITTEALANGETQIIQTSEGPVQLVKVRIPNADGEEEEAWIKIVSE